MTDHHAEHPAAWTETADANAAETATAPATAGSAGHAGHVTPADAADAARLVSFGLQPKLLPARDAEYTELLRRYREDPAFARVADAIATGFGLVVLEVSPAPAWP